MVATVVLPRVRVSSARRTTASFTASTVRDADLIAVLHEGRIAETGRHRDLLATGGFYARLVSRQVAAVAAPSGAGG